MLFRSAATSSDLAQGAGRPLLMLAVIPLFLGVTSWFQLPVLVTDAEMTERR